MWGRLVGQPMPLRGGKNRSAAPTSPFILGRCDQENGDGVDEGRLAVGAGTVGEDKNGLGEISASNHLSLAGPHCNGASKAAVRLARLGLPVKMMIGGVTGWIDEGFSLAASLPADE